MKIEEQVLSIEQMKHLQELGVDTSDASMAYYNISKEYEPDEWILGIANTVITNYILYSGFSGIQPAYTIGDLIEKLPKNIDKKRFTMSYLIAPSVGYSLSKHVMIPSQQNGLVDALYSLLCWVAENHKELMDVKK
ncbi:MAG: hypothetical protein MR924_13665 [Prevotella sp.]|nr:hypothetical protein [Prevotella sp.]